MSGDGVGMGKKVSPGNRLGFGGPVTCTRPFVPSLLGRLVPESKEVGSTAERVQPFRFSLLDVVRCPESERRGVEDFSVRGGLSRGGCDIRDPDLLEVPPKTIRGRSEVAEPDSNGFIVGVGGKSCSDRLLLLSCLGYVPSSRLIESESEDISSHSACDTANRGEDGARIKDIRLRR